MNDVVPWIFIPSLEALLTTWPLPSFTLSPSALAHAVVTMVMAAPVSTIMWPRVRDTLPLSHFDSGPLTATSMCGYRGSWGGATAGAWTILLVAHLTCLMGEGQLGSSPFADALVVAATMRGTSSSTFLAMEMTDVLMAGLGLRLTGEIFISAGPMFD